MGIWKKIAESIKDAGDDWEEVQDLLDEGDMVEALVLVNEKLKEKPQSVGFLYAKGLVLEEFEYYRDALECYDMILSIRPDHKDAIINKFSILIDELDEFQAGLDTLELFPEDLKNENAFQSNKAIALLCLKKFKECEVICKKILKDDRRDAATLECYADSCYERKDYEKSLELTNKILEIIPMDIETQNNKADLLNHLGRSEESLKISESMISRNSMDEEAWANKGVSLIKMSEYEKAINSLQSAVQIDSAFAEAWFHLARAYAHVNNEDDALDSLVVSTSLDSGHNQLEDSSFDNIKNHSRFQKLVSKQKDQVN